MSTGKQDSAAGPMARAVSEEIRSAMARRRLTGLALAEAMGVSPNYVWKRLRDEASFTVNDLDRMRGALGMGGAELLRAAARAIEDDSGAQG